VAPTLLEVIKKRHIDQVLLGWRRPTLTPGRLVSHVVDTLLRQAPCPVIVVKPGDSSQFNRWLLPSAGGPNSKLALRLMPALMTLGQDPQINLCAIATKRDNQPTMHRQLMRRAGILERRLPAAVKTHMTVNEDIATAIVDLSQHYRSDVVILGASRESLFSHVIKGNIPLEVVQKCAATVILVQYNSINAKAVRIVESEDGAERELTTELF
ncbi:MAG: universal stress protein, partial [Cyanobacteria bacterium P01_H01_bin.152]